MSWLSHEKLVGQRVSLHPLSIEHIDGLVKAVKDGESWKLWYASVPRPGEMETYVQQGINEGVRGNPAYTVFDNQNGNIVGTTRFYMTEDTHRRTKLGYTWYGDQARRTSINTESKFLLLNKAFEEHQASAVEFRTHYFNFTSRQAIERLGARQDGILRQHQIMADGSYRDTVVYSIINSEWPTVKQHLQAKMERR